MVNRDIFSTRQPVEADTRNEAGGRAYSKSAEAALAGLACAGTFNGAFYASAKQRWTEFRKTIEACDDEFIAKCAIFGRRSGYMKDIPSAMVAVLFARQSPHFETAFGQVIDNGRMLRNFVQIIRSGALGRKSFGTRGKKAIQKWLLEAGNYKILRAMVGNEPSLRDILRMVHVNPQNSERGELFNYVVNGSFDYEMAPADLKRLHDWKSGGFGSPPPIDWRLCEFPGMTEEHWRTLGRSMGWMALRMNLNTLERHGAFNERAYISEVAARLRDKTEIDKARQFPYQVFQAWKESDSLPYEIQEALQDALELCLEHVPSVDGNVVVIPDVSGSMRYSVTGSTQERRWAQPGVNGASKTRCVDVAGLMAAAFLRKNPGRTRVMPVDTGLHEERINPRDSTVTIADRLASYGGGGTNLSLAVNQMIRDRHQADLVVIVSDNESWADYVRGTRGTGLGAAWKQYRSMFKGAKLVNIDIWGGRTSQTVPERDTLMVSGFSDMVFRTIEAFLEAGNDAGDFWVRKIRNEIAL